MSYMTEADEQIKVVEYCDARGIACFHIPNGGLRNKRTAANLKKQGVKPGVPDLCIPVAKCGYHSLYIEMKAIKNGRISDYQKEWIKLLREQGMAAFVCYGATNAIELIRQYMSGVLGSKNSE